MVVTILVLEVCIPTINTVYFVGDHTIPATGFEWTASRMNVGH